MEVVPVSPFDQDAPFPDAHARAAWAANVLVGQLGDLLAEREDPLVLQEVASLLRRNVVEWAAFYLDDEHLHAADGITGNVTPRRRAPGADPQDPVRALLAGAPVATTVEIDVAATYPTGSDTERFVAQTRVRWSREGIDSPTVRLTGLPGRERLLGFVAWIPRVGEALTGASGLPDGVVTFVARRVGLTVENARAYQVEHRLAQTLQLAMLPNPVSVPGLDTWTYYAPGSAATQVGGDWYEVVPAGRGAVVVVGDVVGHDVGAAAVMGQLRSIVRAYSLEGISPAEILDRTDRLLAVTPFDRFASAIVVCLMPEEEGWSVVYSRAGHLPGLVVRVETVERLDEAAGHLLGVQPSDQDRAEARVELLPGEALVLLTDGLIERRDRSIEDGLAELVDVAARAVNVDAAGIGEDLIAQAGGALEDDVAIVVVRVPDPVGDAAVGRPRRRHWVLPHEPASISAARRVIVHQCRAWDVADPNSAELAASELVTNAVLHGWGPIRLRVEDTGEGLRIEVSDANPAPPVAVPAKPGRVGGAGVRILEQLGDWGWRPLPQGKTVWVRLRTDG